LFCFQVVAVRIPVLEGVIVPIRGRKQEDVSGAALPVVHGGGGRGPRSVVGTVGCRRVCQGRRGGCLGRADATPGAWRMRRSARPRQSQHLERRATRVLRAPWQVRMGRFGVKAPGSGRRYCSMSNFLTLLLKILKLGCMAKGGGVQGKGLHGRGLHGNAVRAAVSGAQGKGVYRSRMHGNRQSSARHRHAR
jgi:hypothetical protein